MDPVSQKAATPGGVSRTVSWWQGLLLAACYFGVAKLGLHFTVVANNVTLIWPPSGLALVAMLMFGVRLWPWLFLGAFVTNFTTGIPLEACLTIAAGNTLEATTALYLLGLDFGTGYSSLSYLHRMSIDTLKIDRSFVRNIPGNGDSEAIARAIVGLGKSMHLDLVAEGVESGTQAEFLKDLGCDLLQGYLFSRPVPAQDFLPLLQLQVDRTLTA